VLGDAKASYDENVSHLGTLVRATDPRHLLTQMSLSHGFFDAGFDPEFSLSDALTQWPLEWLQAFCLRIDIADYESTGPVNPTIARDIEVGLLRVGSSSVAERFRRRQERYGRGPSEQIDGSWEQEQARVARLAVRNWSYRPHMVSIVTRLCEPLDDWAEVELGYRLSAVPTLLFSLEVEVERRGNALLRGIQKLSERPKSAIGMSVRWQKLGLPGTDLAVGLEHDLREGRLSPAELWTTFGRTIKQHLPDLFTFTVTELEALSNGELTQGDLERLLPNLSYRFGDLRTVPVEHLTLGNPVWTRPFIAQEDGTYFCPNPGMGLSHLVDLIGNLVPHEDEARGQDDEESEGRRRWSQARARFLEQRTQEVLAEAFPSGVLHANSKYDDPPVGNDLENDVAVVLDDVVLAVEAKSHRVPPEPWRGAPDGMRESIEKLVLEPSTQGTNFTNYLLRAKRPVPFRNKRGAEFVIDSTNIRYAIRANVVLDPFPVAHNTTLSLREARLLRDGDPDPALTMHFAALESVLVLLPDELQRIHYLARRQIIQRHCRLYAEEHELLALYVEEGFTRPELVDPTGVLVIRGLARKHVDAFLEKWFAGRPPRERPERPLTPDWHRLLAHLQAERPRDWLSIGMALLDASTAEQQDIGDHIVRSVSAVKVADGPTPVEWWSTEVGLTHWKSKIAVVVTRNLEAERRESLVAATVERQGLDYAQSCGVLLFDVGLSLITPVAVMFFPARNVGAS
jgi:hypothetical protein